MEHTGHGEGSPLPALLGCTPTTVSIIFFDMPILTATAKPCMPKGATAAHIPQPTSALKLDADLTVCGRLFGRKAYATKSTRALSGGISDTLPHRARGLGATFTDPENSLQPQNMKPLPGVTVRHSDTASLAWCLEVTWMISAVSGPMRWTPTTVSVSLATRIFMKPRPSFPDSVFFMGLHPSIWLLVFQGLQRDACAVAGFNTSRRCPQMAPYLLGLIPMKGCVRGCNLQYQQALP